MEQTPQPAISQTEIEAAAAGIPAVFRNSPQFACESLGQRLGQVVLCKVETVNPIGCFKGRGSWWALSRLVKDGKVGQGRDVITASSGNFGLGLAYAGRELEVGVTVVVSRSANAAKIDRLRALGAEVVVVADTETPRESVYATAEARGLEVVLDGTGTSTVTGAATIALEVAGGVKRGEIPRPDAVYVPVGAGSLIAGIGSGLRRSLPGTRIVGVQAEGAPAMTISWREQSVVEVESPGTYADGIDFNKPDAEMVRLMAAVVDDMVLVSDEQLRAAQRELTQDLGVTVEAAGAAGWAGLRSRPADGPAMIIITGANVWPGEITWSAPSAGPSGVSGL